MRAWTLRTLGAAAAVVVLLGTALAGPSQAVPATDLVVEDTAGVLYLPQLEESVAGIDFHEPTTVAVYTRRGTASDNFNEQVLAFARERHPEWISADGQKWRDGLFILALDPDGRHVGTYFGEDRKVSLDLQEDIQEATKEAFREARWTDGTVDGIARAAELMNRPWYLSPLPYVLGGSGAALGSGTWATVAYVRSRRRKRFAAALDDGEVSYAAVTNDLDATELNAATVPGDSAYGRMLLEKYSDFTARHRAATELYQKLQSTPARARGTRSAVAEAERFQTETLALDGLDDAIAQANDLLNLSSRWRQAWREQTSGLLADLDALPGMLAGDDAQPHSATAAALKSFAESTRVEVEAWGAGLADRSLTPDQALDRLHAARKELARLLSAYSETLIAAATKSPSEAKLMRREIAKAREEDLRHRRRGTIVDVGYPNLGGWSVAAYAGGFSAGHQAVEHAREQASTGYGSSGGSFSGSGSSSNF